MSVFVYKFILPKVFIIESRYEHHKSRHKVFSVRTYKMMTNHPSDDTVLFFNFCTGYHEIIAHNIRMFRKNTFDFMIKVIN